MAVIYKYDITLPRTSAGVFLEDIEIEMPQGSRLLTVGIQNGTPVMWCLADQDAPKITRRIKTIGTGIKFDINPSDYSRPFSDAPYVGTYQQDWFVGHVFDGGEELYIKEKSSLMIKTQDVEFPRWTA